MLSNLHQNANTLIKMHLTDGKIHKDIDCHHRDTCGDNLLYIKKY